ncbi:MAG: hypothetical protein ABIE23_05500 [archaeon]
MKGGYYSTQREDEARGLLLLAAVVVIIILLAIFVLTQILLIVGPLALIASAVLFILGFATKEEKFVLWGIISLLIGLGCIALAFFIMGSALWPYAQGTFQAVMDANVAQALLPRG